MRRGRLLALLFIALLVATGCEYAPLPVTPTDHPGLSGSVETQAATPTETAMRSGRYTFKAATGGTGMMEVPAAPVAQIEELRSLVNAVPVTYLKVTVDNRHGSVAINMHGVRITTLAGAELKYERASVYVDTLRRELPDDVPAETNSRFIDISNAYNDAAQPLTVQDFVLVGPEAPREFSGITVYPTAGFHPVPAVPAE
jgi:hypothetical protein